MSAHEHLAAARYELMSTPVGDLTLYVGTEGRLQAIDFGNSARRHGAAPDSSACAHVRRQLEEYFSGMRRRFELELDPHGTDFQRRVWRALLDIPYGATSTYGEIARRLGPGTAARAVGTANGSNPIPIVIPCHRVIGADGSLTGYGGGVHIKARLLALETPQRSLGLA